MKLLMTCTEDLEAKIGVKKKVFGQMKAFCSHNMEVWLLYNHGGRIVLVDGAGRQEQVLGRTANIFHFQFAFFTRAYEVVTTLHPDAIYERATFTEPNYINFLKKVKQRHIPLFVEYPTYPYDEEYKHKSLFKRLLFQVDKYYRQQLHHYIAHAFTYTNYQDIFGIPATRIENGIDVEQIPVRSPKTSNPETCTLLGVANLAFWQGYDRVIEGLKNYYASENKTQTVYFHLIGTGPEFKKLQELVATYKLQEVVRFSGAQYEDDLYASYNSADIGVSTLAFHRKGLAEGASLKSREYCAVGLPFVYAFQDHDFSENFEYALNISGDDTPVDILNVLNFYKTIVRKNTIADMRRYAENTLDWRVKLAPIVKKMSSGN